MYNHIATLGSCVEPYLTGVFMCSLFHTLGWKHYANSFVCINLHSWKQYLHKPAQSIRTAMMVTGIISQSSLIFHEHKFSLTTSMLFLLQSCTLDVCVSGSCSNTMQDNCCGNLICEAGESSCSDDCGPFSINSPTSCPCGIAHTYMFSVEAINNVILSSITVTVYAGETDVTLYTASVRLIMIASIYT